MSSVLERIEEEGKKIDQLWNQMYGSESQDAEKTEEEQKSQALDIGSQEKEQAQEKEPGVPEQELPAEPTDDWKHKYDVLRGKYDSEVPRLAYELAQANQKMMALQKEIEELKASMTKQAEQPKAMPKQEPPSIKQLREEYPDIFEGVRSLIEEAVHEKLSKTLEETVKPISQEITTVKDNLGKTERERYLMILDNDPYIGKEWRKINENPKFIEWLQEPEPFTGITKYQLLMDAWNKMDAPRTIRFFKEFKSQSKSDTSKSSKLNLKDEDLHLPRGQKGVERKEEPVEIITPEMYAKFTRDVIAGKWKGREAEMEKEEQRLLRGLLRLNQK